MASFHDLGRYCRVCGGLLQRGKRKDTIYTCSSHQKSLQDTFGVDVSNDRADVHPQQYCSRCYSVVRRQSAAAAQGVPYRHSVAIFNWQEHTEEDCTVSSNSI